MPPAKLHIRPATPADFDAIWPFFRAVVREAQSYPYAPSIGKAAARRLWFSKNRAVYIAFCGDEAAGSYYLRPNQPSLGAHVANAGYMVSPNFRGQGVGRAMCRHSQQQARAMGYKAMQYNLVVTKNTAAVRLWKKMGFGVVGKLRGAFWWRQQEYVDALIMYKTL